jgi:hypothetical protein
MTSMNKMLDQGRRIFLIRGGLLLASLSPQQTPVALPQKITLGTDADENTHSGIWLRSLYAEASRRLEIPIDIVTAPLKRVSMLIANEGIDGEVARGPAYGAAHPELIELEVDLFPIVFSIYSNKALPGMTSLKELAASKYVGVYRRDVVFCEELLKPLFPAKRLTTTSHTERSFAMIAANHADFTCEVSSAIMNTQYAGD